MKIDFIGMLVMTLSEVAESSFVRRIIEKSRTELAGDKLHMHFQDVGIAFIASLKGNVESIQFFSDGFQEYRGYAGELPEEIRFSSSQLEIQEMFGAPDGQGGGAKLPPPFGIVPPWLRYDREKYSVHLQFCDGGSRIDLVSLMRPDVVPR